MLTNLSRLPEIAKCYRETEQWQTAFRSYLDMGGRSFPYLLRLRSGTTLTLREHNDVIIFWLVFVRQHYPVLPSDRVVLDVGANIGIFTIYAAREAPAARIIAVEPFPATRERLQVHLEDNRLTSRVTVLNCAVAQEAGRGEMDSVEGIPSQYRRIRSEKTESLNIRHRGAAGLQSGPGISVEQKTLAEILEVAGEDAIDLMKMNIHGMEYSVLMNTPAAILRRIKRITVQYHTMPSSSGIGKTQLFSHLNNCGFRLVNDYDTQRGSGLAVLSREAFQA